MYFLKCARLKGLNHLRVQNGTSFADCLLNCHEADELTLQEVYDEVNTFVFAGELNYFFSVFFSDVHYILSRLEKEEVRRLKNHYSLSYLRPRYNINYHGLAVLVLGHK